MTTLAASKQLKVRRSSSCSLILLLVFFDEVQRAPEIFRALKINVDSRSDKGLYWFAKTIINVSGIRCPARQINEFEKFLITIARRVGQELRLQEIAKEVGVSQPTVKRWLSIAEASGIIHLLSPYAHNVGKQLVKSPKLYFTDTGLVCHLLNLQNGKELSNSYLAGNIFENFVVNEIKKAGLTTGKKLIFIFTPEWKLT